MVLIVRIMLRCSQCLGSDTCDRALIHKMLGINFQQSKPVVGESYGMLSWDSERGYWHQVKCYIYTEQHFLEKNMLSLYVQCTETVKCQSTKKFKGHLNLQFLKKF